MHRVLRVSSFALLFAFAASAFAAHVHVPKTTWKFNPDKSTFGKGPSFKSDIYTLHDDSEKKMSYTETYVDSDGKVFDLSWKGDESGTPAPITGMPGATYRYETVADSALMILPDGSRVNQQYIYAPDRKSVTVSVTYSTREGKIFHQELHYDRVK